ncbi:hypothetical protein [Flavobacterium sp. F52]|jgi:hypothetical protein|uniref:hypothetical protein n=1 Tax=Flavobacterium sp. F52 TaxID=1202532 RepID=UPI000272D5A3|nr:hypothetical protein [Flavobacterium sp. F52]EJF99227.1 hypothetical protein FF52_22319 [Flavobacterium sp. F52]
MIENILLPLAVLIVGLIYSKWLCKINNGFFRKNVDLFSNSKDLQGWFAALVLIVTGFIFLLKGIFNYTS